MTDGRKLKIGFVGVGAMGQCAHLRNFASLPDCEVVALAEIRPELARRVAQRYGVARVYPSHGELLANEQLDGIVASQPFTRHGVLVPELVAAGVPVMTEKPLASTIAAGERIVEAVRAGGSWLMVGYHKRSDPATEWVHGEIQRLRGTDELGKLRYVRVTMPPGDWVAHGFDDYIRSDEPTGTLEQEPAPADMDAETFRRYIEFVNYYIHQVNLVRHLLGEDYEVVGADPTGVLLHGRSASGLPCLLEMAPWSNTMDWQERALVCFERGWLRLELPAPLASLRAGSVEYYYDPGNRVPELRRPQMPWEHAMRRQAENFCRAIRGEAPPPCGAEEALKDLIVARDYILALEESRMAKTGR